MISLRPVDTNNYRECIELSVAPEQQGFVASNLQSLADAYVWREAAEPYAVYSDDEMVGFALLFPFAGDVDDDSIPEPGTERGMVLVRLMIDGRFQGRGYGRDAWKRSSSRFVTAGFDRSALGCARERAGARVLPPQRIRRNRSDPRR
jgi:GNAT superfamily N-acetyltransferase